MASVNKAIILGNVGRDPEVRRTGDGKAIANVSVATSERWKDRNSGEQREKTEWHRVSVFGGLAEVVEKYLKKGDSVYFEGKIQTRKWTDKDNQERYTTEVVVDMGGVMQMLGGRSGGGSGSYSNDDGMDQTRGASASSAPAAAAAPKKISDDAPFDDEIPF